MRPPSGSTIVPRRPRFWVDGARKLGPRTTMPGISGVYGARARRSAPPGGCEKLLNIKTAEDKEARREKTGRGKADFQGDYICFLFNFLCAALRPPRFSSVGVCKRGNIHGVREIRCDVELCVANLVSQPTDPPGGGLTLWGNLFCIAFLLF